jgi:hypothetical protein
MSDFVMNKDQEPLERRSDELREDLFQRDVNQLTELTGTTLRSEDGESFFDFLYWGKPVLLSSRDFLARDPESQHPLPPIHQTMIMYYFHSSKGSPDTGNWISFSELADGQFYNSAFQGYTARKLAQYFQTDYDKFEARNEAQCGVKVDFGDGAYRYQILPQIAILIVYWKGDEEFPPSYKILFEDIADYHLPTDGCAILGSMLVGKLMAE